MEHKRPLKRHGRDASETRTTESTFEPIAQFKTATIPNLHRLLSVIVADAEQIEAALPLEEKKVRALAQNIKNIARGGVRSLSAAAAAERAPALDGGHETILLVHHDSAARDALERGLEYLGYTVLTGENLAASIELVQQHREAIALSLIDAGTAAQAGTQLYRALRTDGKELRVVLTGAEAEGSRRRRRRSDPAVGTLSSSWKLVDLARTVRFALDGIESVAQRH